MKYKAIALDIDGTLKNDKNEITPKTKQILQDLIKRGVIVILASGRPTEGLIEDSELLGLNKLGGYLLSFNGAKIIKVPSNETVYDVTFSKDIVHKIYIRAKEYKLAVMTYHDGKIVTEDNEDEYVKVESEINGIPMNVVDDFIQATSYDVNKVLLTGKPEYIADIVDDFKKPYEEELSIYRSAPFFIEVMNKGINKGDSLIELMKHCGLSIDELIAFGDGYNDEAMIKTAGLGVAMGNAVQEVKDIANDVCGNNNEDGIYHYLNKLVEEGRL